MSNSDNHNGDDKVVQFQHRNGLDHLDHLDNFEKQILELNRMIREDMKRQEKFAKRAKILSLSLLIYIATIVLVGVMSIVYPSFRPIGDMFLLFCNVIGVGLCVWNVISLFKNRLIEEGIGKWLLAFSVFGVAVNLFAVFDTYIIERFLS